MLNQIFQVNFIKAKTIQWIITTIKQLSINKDESIERFKKAVLNRVGELVRFKGKFNLTLTR